MCWCRCTVLHWPHLQRQHRNCNRSQISVLQLYSPAAYQSNQLPLHRNAQGLCIILRKHSEYFSFELLFKPCCFHMHCMQLHDRMNGWKNTAQRNPLILNGCNLSCVWVRQATGSPLKNVMCNLTVQIATQQTEKWCQALIFCRVHWCNAGLRRWAFFFLLCSSSLLGRSDV